MLEAHTVVTLLGDSDRKGQRRFPWQLEMLCFLICVLMTQVCSLYTKYVKLCAYGLGTFLYVTYISMLRLLFKNELFPDYL